MRTLRRFLTLLLAATIAFTATAYGVEGDQDNDGIIDSQDNCPAHANPDQADRNANKIGNACDDPDKDGLSDQYELYTTYGGGASPRKTNPDRKDTDGDGLSDGYETNRAYANGRRTDPTLRDTDADGWEDGTETYAGTDPTDSDTDDDGHRDSTDNCAKVYNPDQKNTWGGPRGDACDPEPKPEDPCEINEPCYPEQIEEQVNQETQPVRDAADGAVVTADKTVKDVLAMIPGADVRTLADLTKMATDGYIVKVVQTAAGSFTVQVISAATNQPVSMNLPGLATYSVNGPVGVFGYAADPTPAEASRINVKWRYLHRSKTLTIKVLPKQTHSGPVSFQVPPLGYPADCSPSTTPILGTKHCDGTAVGFYNPAKNIRPTDALDAVPFAVTVSA